jgi:hypothetical protein
VLPPPLILENIDSISLILTQTEVNLLPLADFDKAAILGLVGRMQKASVAAAERTHLASIV